MKICPKCHFEISEQDKFCINCGYSFKAAANRKFAIILGIMCLLFFGFIGLLFHNYRLEQEYMQPYKNVVGCGDDTCQISSTYNMEDKQITIEIIVEYPIETWQKEVLNKKDLISTIKLMQNSEQISIKGEPYELKTNEYLKLKFVLKDARLKDFVKLKESFTNGLTLELPAAICNDLSERKRLKNEYLAQQERNRKAAAARYHMEQLFMNGLISPYTYYGSY